MSDPRIAKEEIDCTSCLETIKIGDDVFDGEDGDICLRCEDGDTKDSYYLLGLCPHGLADDQDCEECGGAGGSENRMDYWD